MEPGYTDAELIAMLRSNRREAFPFLYKAYYAMVLYFVQRNSGFEEDAADVFQETMIAVYEKTTCADFTLTASLKTFVYSVARNIWLKKLRGKKSSVDVKDFENHMAVDDEPEEDNAPLLAKVQQGLAALGDKCRRVLLMYYYEKRSMDHIALALGYSNAHNAKNQKYKCLQQLKKNFNAN